MADTRFIRRGMSCPSTSAAGPGAHFYWKFAALTSPPEQQAAEIRAPTSSPKGPEAAGVQVTLTKGSRLERPPGFVWQYFQREADDNP